MRVIVLFSLLLASLATFAQEDNINPASTATKWFKDVHTVFNYSYPDSSSFAPERTAGKNWIFEYTHHAAENPAIADDEFKEIIAFEINPQKVKCRKFKLKDEQLLAANAYYLRGCFCRDRGYSKIQHGTITGKKVNKTTWQITIDVLVNSDNGLIPKRYTGRFELIND